MPGPDALSSAEARWLAITAQGLGRPRPKGPITRRHLRAMVGAIGTIQLDAINVLARTQFLVPFSRVGAYDVRRLHAMTGPGGELWEYWGHAASLLPVETEPLFRWRMAMHGPFGDSPTNGPRRVAWRRANSRYIASVRKEVREHGPMPASRLSDPRRRDGEWWDRRSVGRQALEALFADGELAGWRTPNFERVYDLPERVLPERVRNTPTPAVEDAQRALLLRSAQSLGIATAGDLAYYFMINPRVAKPLVAALAAEGALVPVTVEGWRDRAYMLPGTRVNRPRREHATLLSPFDSLIWERARTKRLFDFDYTIEVYVPEPKRRYGYYVLPLLLGDRLVGRFDLKADRKGSTLQVRGAYVEWGADVAVVAAAAAPELRALAIWLGLDAVTVARRGNLARLLGPALA